MELLLEFLKIGIAFIAYLCVGCLVFVAMEDLTGRPLPHSEQLSYENADEFGGLLLRWPFVLNRVWRELKADPDQRQCGVDRL